MQRRERLCRWIVAAAVAGAAAGCGEEGTRIAGGAPTPSPTIVSPADFGPALFDCTSLGADGSHLPPRASTVPIDCAFDPACRTPQIAGHRGAGGALGMIAPEDTLAAYRAGIALGIEFVETDPRPTADGVIVNLHDTTVDRTTDGTGAVDQMTFAALRTLHIKAGTLAGDFSCERVPTLTEVLRTCRGRVVVLVDANKTDRVDLLVQAIHDADAVDWSIFDTSSVDKIDRALAIEPRLHFQIRPGLAEIAAQLDHLAPRLPANVELQATDVQVGAPLVHARGARVFSNVFAHDVAAGLGDVTAYARAFNAGIDIVQTERPELVLAFLRARGLR